MARRYPKEFHEFMKEYIPGHTAAEISEEAKKRLGIEISPAGVKSYKQNHKIRSGTPTGLPKGHYSDTFPEAVVKYILKHYKGTGPQAMADLLNKKFKTCYTKQQIKGFYGNHGLNSGLTGRYEKGHVSHNKGKKGEYAPGSEKGWFKKEHEPHNRHPVGTIHKRADGYLWEKFGPGINSWKPHHQLVWERANGPTPEGYVLIFKDNDRENCDLENLALVSMAESLELTRKGLRTENKELTESGILVARLNCAISKSKKKKEGTDNG